MGRRQALRRKHGRFGGQVWALLGIKFAGTILACSLLLLVYWKNARLGTLIASALAALQLSLLLFLLLG